MDLPHIGLYGLVAGLLLPIAFFGGLGLLAYVLIRPQPWRPYTGPDRDRQAAALLAIFLGTIGAHKWYLQRPREAVLYVLFCWTWVPTIVGVIEGIWYLSMSDAAFRMRVVERRSEGAEPSDPRGFTRQSPPWSRSDGPAGMPPGWDLCAVCRTLNPLDARFCLRCGATIPRRPTGSPDLYTGAPCRACGMPTVVGADHCTDCGAPIAPGPAAAAPGASR